MTIKDIDGLHKAIGRALVGRKKTLSGKEVRFLRHEMLMSQYTLAALIGVTEQAIRRWENGKTLEVPGPADALIRFLYWECIGEKQDIRKGLKRIADLEDKIDGLVTMIDGRKGWTIQNIKSAA